jgi:uncharacterized protein YkwD
MASEPGASRIDSNQFGNARLVSIGGASPREYPLDKPSVTVGSHPSNDVALDDITVSRRHAIIARKLEQVQVTDLDSTNGTFVNGARLRAPANLRRGDEVRFGSVRFVFGTDADRDAIARNPAKPFRAGLVAAIVLLMFACGFAAIKFRDRLASVIGVVASRPGERTSDRKPTTIESVPSTSASNPSASASQSPASSTAETAREATAPGWLRRINYYRALAKLPPVTEDQKLSDGDRAHSIYIVKNYRDAIMHGGLGAEMHTEDPGKPFFTPEGLDAAKSSDLDQWYMHGDAGEGSDPTDPDEWAAARAPGSAEWNIDGWMAIPFHRLPILNPRLRRAGFGMYCEAGACTAGMNLLTGASAERSKMSLDSSVTGPIVFPADGSSISINSFGNEWPDPRASCPGYQPPSGVAITIQLDAFIDTHLGEYSIAREAADGTLTKLQACGFDSTSYANPDAYSQQLGRDILKDYGAIVVIPRAPLAAGGKYFVSISVNGRPYQWHFSIYR